MTTRRDHDLLNRLRRVESLSTAANTLGLVFDYQYNQANQRRKLDNGDGTHWAIEYDDLGQVVGGKKLAKSSGKKPAIQRVHHIPKSGMKESGYWINLNQCPQEPSK